MKKMMNKKTLAILVAGVALLALPLFASAEDKLVVQDAGQNDVFTVDDTGTVSANKMGIGTATPANTLSVVSELSVPERGFAVIHYPDNAASPNGQFWKGRGTEASPTSVQQGDYTGAFQFRNYDGTSWVGNGFFGAYVSGPVSTNNVPTDIFFCNSNSQISNCFGENKVNLIIKSTGAVNMPKLANTYTGGSAYVCVNNAGDIYASETQCP